MFFLAGYGNHNFGPWPKPEVNVRFERVPDTDYQYAFVIGKWGLVLSDKTKVKISQSPLKPSLEGKEGLWGSFREELQCSNQDLHDKDRLRKIIVGVDVLDPDPLWLVVDFAGRSVSPLHLIVEIEVELKKRQERLNYWKQQNKELQDTISRRNRLTKDLRRNNRENREKAGRFG